jgi:transposase-like protein
MHPIPAYAGTRSRLDELIESYRESYPKLDEDIEQTLTCFRFAKPQRRKLRTANGLKRLNEGIRRRSKVARGFPNDKACIRLTAALAMEQSEEWLTGRRYLGMSPLEEQCAPLNVLTGTDPG